MATADKSYVWYDRRTHMTAVGKGLKLRRGAAILHETPVLMEHFIGSAANLLSTGATTVFRSTSGGSGTPFTTMSTSIANGAVRGITGATNANAECLCANQIIWKPANGRIVAEFGILTDSNQIAAGEFFVGMGDAATYASGLAYAISSTSTFSTSVPSDAAVFGFSSTATSGAAFLSGGNSWFAATSKAGTDTATALSNPVAVTSNTYYKFRIEIDTDGTCSFYRNGDFQGTVAAAVTASVALSPWVGAVARSSTAAELTIDYVHVSQDTNLYTG